MAKVVYVLFCLIFSFICGQNPTLISLSPGFSCESGDGSVFETRIFHGIDAAANLAPWNVILEMKIKENTAEIVNHCGGNILSPTIILTAAHCLWLNGLDCPQDVRNLNSATDCHELEGGCPGDCLRVRAKDLNVYAGVTNTSQTERIKHQVETIILHEKWNKGTDTRQSGQSGHDLAILKLRNELKFERTVRPICLPPSNFETEENVSVYGFGYFKWDGPRGVPATSLQKGNLIILNKDECLVQYENHRKALNYAEISVQGDQLCAISAGPKARDTCRGDSGGGLVKLVNGSKVLVGVVSFGSGRCNGEVPAVFTNVKSHMTWILQKVWGIDCVTVSGPSTGSPCVFPFTYKGKTYSRCTLDGTPENDKVPWCSTKVDSQGNHVAGRKFWGRCNPKCGQPDGPPPDILLESRGGAAEHWGETMGYYYYYNNLNQRPAFKQKGGGYYLYYYEETGVWLVGDTLGGSSSALYVTSTGSTPPSYGWEYWDGESDRTDSTLRLDTSPSDPWSTCTNIKVAATGPAGSAQSKKMGNYRWGGEWLNGRKIFKGGRDGDMYLRVIIASCATGGTPWGIHSTRDSVVGGIQSGKATTCPCSQAAGPSVRFGVDWWQYADDGWHVDRSISVTCV